jgi:putative endonuclease
MGTGGALMGGTSDPRRRLGARGEELAARHLEARGFEVVERNFRTRYGELDIIARDPRFLVFCEVKTRISRRGPGVQEVLGPFAAIGPRKQRQVRAMAREWLARGALDGARPPELRFDAIGISFDGAGRLVSLEHLEAAF